MMGFSSLSIFFWRYALESVCYILNKILSKSVSKMRHEMWIRCKPVLSHLRVWRCPAHVKYLKTDKLGSRSDKYLFVGYPKEIKKYYFYLSDEQKVFVSNRAIFLEKKFLGERINVSKIELDEVRSVEEPTQSSKSIESDLIRSNSESIIETSLRKFNRVPRQPNRYYDFLV